MNQSKEEPKTYLTEDTIRGLKSIFATEEDYIKHMETLWALRELSMKAIEYKDEEGVFRFDTQNPHFRIYELTNDMIGVLLQDGINFFFNGNSIQHSKTKTSSQ